MFPGQPFRLTLVLSSTIRELLIVLVGGSLLGQLIIGLRGQPTGVFQGLASSEAAATVLAPEAVSFRLDASDPSRISQIDLRLPAGLPAPTDGDRLFARLTEDVRLPCWDLDGDQVWSCPATGVTLSQLQRVSVELD